jgi:arylsulfatase A-like enzyme
MRAPNILVIVVDGLRASALGAYGNTSTPTPALDQFAADSYLLDWCFSPSVELAGIYRALWESIHPARPSHFSTSSLPQILAASGYTTTLITDEPQMPSIAAADHFDQCIQLQETVSAAAMKRVAETSQTSMARMFAPVCELVASDVGAADLNQPRLIWAHSRGMYGPWDAPLELQQSLLDEGDPPPVESTTPPDFLIAPSDDPDAAFRFACAYAAQAIVLDECWTGILQTVEAARDGDRWIVTLLGARGLPLGEHLRIGGVDSRLYAEQLHVPCLIRLPDRTNRLARNSRLTSHVDLLPTLLSAVALDTAHVGSESDGMNVLRTAMTSSTVWRDALIATSESAARAIRTADWCLLQDTQSSPVDELYVRPDDRWETNDVAKLCPEIVESLSSQMDEELQQLSRLKPEAEARSEPP